MTRFTSLAVALLFACLAGCGGGNGPAANEQTGPTSQRDGQRAGFLPTPYSAEQIRAEWIPGFTLEMERTTAEGTGRERWTVIEADEESVAIAFEKLGADRAVEGEPRVQHARWDELRDHALFPQAGGARRERVKRETALGEFEGWLYTVPDGERGTVSEFFFGLETPGAPLLLVTREAAAGGALIERLEQVARSRPEAR